MPSRNILKQYVPNGIYHVYNRGVEKRHIFTDKRDYKTFLYFLKQYLIDPDDSSKDTVNYKGRTFVRRSFADRIRLLAYCLMPNHFHLIIQQKGRDDMSEFMKCLATSYSLYFNDRQDRVGGLFQGRYKAVLIENNEQLLHLSRYIHQNPLSNKGPSFVKLQEYDYSSFQDYIGARDTKWVKPEFVLGLVGNDLDSRHIKNELYKKFIIDFVKERGALKEELGDLTLE